MVNGHSKKGPRATKLLSHTFLNSQPSNSFSGPTRINEKNGVNGRRNIASNHRMSRNKGFSWPNAGRFLCLLINRGAVKAKRRQWDPPKKARQPDAPASASGPAPDDQPDNCAIDPGPLISLTEPERFALDTLLELSQPAPPLAEAMRTPEPPETLDDEDRPVESGIDLPEGREVLDHSDGPCVSYCASRLTLWSELLTFHSSLEAVNQEPIHRRLGDWENVFAKELPFYARPASSAQKKIQRELGVIGPLTGTQQMQIAAAALGDPFDGDLPELDVVVEPYLSQQRWDRILQWRETEFDNEWDAGTRRGFAEAVLCRLYRS
ncbi:hypothetical protein B0H16DRAFT_1461137 [Mycena metata]|uniref:Uncharacterized protein n=1 Tax=Mycena metata TaxID=1033252 RepID=A0AAD7IT03_9AGAR|nr:hypothetical protein B0H16DRAFT_1461137 [Mycena metata]